MSPGQAHHLSLLHFGQDVPHHLPILIFSNGRGGAGETMMEKDCISQLLDRRRNLQGCGVIEPTGLAPCMLISTAELEGPRGLG